MSDKAKNHMTPVDAGAPVLIPQGNLNPDGGGSYGASGVWLSGILH